MKVIANLRFLSVIFCLFSVLSSFFCLLNEGALYWFFAPFSLICFVFNLYCNLNNIFFFFRNFIIGLVGYYPIFIKLIAGPDAFFSLYEFSTQGMDIVMVMYVGTSLALLGSEVGFFLSRPSRFGPIANIAIEPSSLSLWRTVFLVSIPIVLLVSYITAKTVGQSVLAAAYGSAVGGEPQLLGNTQNIGIICLLVAYASSVKLNLSYRRFLLAGLILIFLVWAMFLHGLRQDVVTALFGLAVCKGLLDRNPLGLSFGRIILIFLIVIVAELMGIARTTLASDAFSLSDLFNIAANTLLDNRAYHFGTVSPIATTFANIVTLVDTNQVQLLWGQTYAEFIPRTPPEFIYPNRPQDYAWIFPKYGLVAGGGFYELAEAYINFGLLGCLVMPGLLSFLMGKFYFNALHRQTLFSYMLIFTFLGMFLRGTWYQVFAFYKSFLTAMVLYVFFLLIHQYVLPLIKQRRLVLQ